MPQMFEWTVTFRQKREGQWTVREKLPANNTSAAIQLMHAKYGKDAVRSVRRHYAVIDPGPFDPPGWN